MTNRLKSRRKKSKAENYLPEILGTRIGIFGLIMLIFGIIMIFNASVKVATEDPFNNRFHFLNLHLVWVVAGLIGGSFIYFWDYRKFIKLVPIVLIVMVGLLIGVLVWGITLNGATRWITLGHPSLRIQPAEFAKPVIVLYLASWLAKERQQYKSFKDALKFGFGQKLIQFGFVLGTILLLIYLQPDFGTTMLIGLTSFILFFISGTDIAHTAGSIITAAVTGLIATFAAMSEEYRRDRIKVLFDVVREGRISEGEIGGDGYQLHQILLALGDSGPWGTGFTNSTLVHYLTENAAFTDSIAAVIFVELGLPGVVIFISSWIAFAYFGFKLAKKAPDREGRYLALGVTIWLTLQAFIHIGANVGVVPMTGMPLPFISYGGSATMMAIIGIALLLNVSRITNQENAGRRKKIR